MSVNLFDKKYKSLKPIAGIPTSISVDDTLSETSENPVQNKVVNEAIDKVNSELTETKKSVSDGKALVATAITGKGVATEDTATFAVMADNISKIETGGGELHGASISGTTADTFYFGKTIKLLLDSTEVMTTVVGDDGAFSFIDIQNVGTYTVSITEEGITSTNTVTINAEHIVNKTILSTTITAYYATVVVSTEETTLFGKTANLYNGDTFIKSYALSSSGSLTFRMIDTGNYIIKATGTEEAIAKFEITSTNINNKQTVNVYLSYLEIVTFADGTDEQIAEMINAHYAGKINLSDYWSVGDKRKIHINAMSKTVVNESHHADDYDFVIIGFDHDDLVTSENRKTKAALSLQLDRILFKDTTTTSYNFTWNTNEECGYMNSTNTNVGGWTDCARRTWCNDVFVKSLPLWLQALIKPVYKKTSAGNKTSSINTTEDKAFLLSEIEIFGTAKNSFEGEGTQYEYFKTTSNKYKLPTYKRSSGNSSLSVFWWERSPYRNYTTHFCLVNTDGVTYYIDANRYYGLAPAICV